MEFNYFIIQSYKIKKRSLCCVFYCLIFAELILFYYIGCDDGLNTQQERYEILHLFSNVSDDNFCYLIVFY
tara:strand:+ start:749 stop:961 length:213 start_codon:yes stop_codon:yes gene_type:complete